METVLNVLDPRWRRGAGPQPGAVDERAQSGVADRRHLRVRRDEPADGTATDGAYKRVAMVSGVVSLLLVAIVVLMVAKP